MARKAKPTKLAPAQRVVLPNAYAPMPDGSEIHAEADTQECSDLVAISSELAEVQKVRRFAIVSQSRCDRSIEAFIASQLGYRTSKDRDAQPLTEAMRKELFKRAQAIRESVERSHEISKLDAELAIEANAKKAQRLRSLKNARERMQADGDHRATDTQTVRVPATLRAMIVNSALARSVWDEARANAEAKMESLASQSRLAPWAKGIAGLGLLSLAIILAEAYSEDDGKPRTLADYRTVSGLWTRLGLAVIKGERQRKKRDKAEAAEHAYSPRRRAQVYAICSVSMFMAQKPGMKYRDIYDRRKAHTTPRIEATSDLASDNPSKWTPKRCDNDARRVMTKELLKDLWIAARPERRHAPDMAEAA